MIQKYQIIDTMLIYMASGRNEEFFISTFMRAFFEYYFLKYEADLTPKFHRISQENINYIMSPIDLFTKQELQYMREKCHFSNIEASEKKDQPLKTKYDKGCNEYNMSVLKSQGSGSGNTGSHVFSFSNLNFEYKSLTLSLQSFETNKILANSVEKDSSFSKLKLSKPSSSHYSKSKSNSKFKTP